MCGWNDPIADCERESMQATSLRFISVSEIEFQLCEYSLAETQRKRGKIRCS